MRTRRESGRGSKKTERIKNSNVVKISSTQKAYKKVTTHTRTHSARTNTQKKYGKEEQTQRQKERFLLRRVVADFTAQPFLYIFFCFMFLLFTAPASSSSPSFLLLNFNMQYFFCWLVSSRGIVL